MRTLLSGLAVTAAVLLGTLALSAHVLAHTLLDPGRSVRVAAAVTDDVIERAVADEALTGVLGPEGPESKKRLERLRNSPEVRAALDRLTVHDGQVDTTALRDAVAGQLRDRGMTREADRVLAQGPTAVAPPGGLRDQVRDTTTGLRDTTLGFAKKAALWALLLAAAGVLAARRRDTVTRGLGRAILGMVGVTLAVFLALPWLIRAGTDDGWLHTLAGALTASGGQLATPLLPFGALGVALLVLAAALPGSPRMRYPTQHPEAGHRTYGHPGDRR